GDRAPLEVLVSPTIGVHRSLSISTDHGLWILPEPWKTQKTRFPPLLGRRSRRAAHKAPQALRSPGLFEGRSNPENDKSTTVNWSPIERKRLAPYGRNLTTRPQEKPPKSQAPGTSRN